MRHSWLLLKLALTVHCALVEDIRDRIVQDLGLSRTPDLLQVRQSPVSLDKVGLEKPKRLQPKKTGVLVGSVSVFAVIPP